MFRLNSAPDRIYFIAKGTTPETWYIRFDSLNPAAMAIFASRRTGPGPVWDDLTPPQAFIEARLP
jgi:hypothetical protein